MKTQIVAKVMFSDMSEID